VVHRQPPGGALLAGSIAALDPAARFEACTRRPLTPRRPPGAPQADAGAKIHLGRVLALKHAGKFHVGKPYLENITVEAEILEDLKGPKVIVYKMKPKKHYRRTNGHRQPLTKFVVTKISQ
jgi:ribosomal protein L21